MIVHAMFVYRTVTPIVGNCCGYDADRHQCTRSGVVLDVAFTMGCTHTHFPRFDGTCTAKHNRWRIDQLIVCCQVSAWSNFAFTLTRIRVWLYRRMMSRFWLAADPPKRLFELFIGFGTSGLGLIFTMPFVTLMCWAVLLITQQDRLAGLSVLFMGMCVMMICIGVGRWMCDGWRMRAPIAVALAFAVLFYFTAAFLLSFFGNATFFANSVHFLALNFLCIVELMCVTEDTHRVDIEHMLDLSDEDLTVEGLVSARDPANPPSNTTAAGATDTKTVAVTSSATVAPAPSGSTDTKVAVPPIEVKAAFAEEPTRKLKFGTVAVRKRESSMQMFVTYYGSSVAILVAYTIAIWKYLTFQYYLGLIVSITIVVLDAGLYLYATTGRLSSSTAKLLLLAGIRITLVSFGTTQWFLGIAVVYTLAGVFLGYAIVDYHLPLSDTQKSLIDKGFTMRFSEFMSPFFDFKRMNTLADPERSQLNRTLKSLGNAIIEVVLGVLSTLR